MRPICFPVYDPYGALTVLTPTWMARGTSAYGWIYLFQGERFDPTVSLFDVHGRVYSPTLDRPLQADPLGLAPGVNDYRWEDDSPTDRTDPTGLISPGDPGFYKLPFPDDGHIPDPRNPMLPNIPPGSPSSPNGGLILLPLIAGGGTAGGGTATGGGIAVGGTATGGGITVAGVGIALLPVGIVLGEWCVYANPDPIAAWWTGLDPYCPPLQDMGKGYRNLRNWYYDDLRKRYPKTKKEDLCDIMRDDYIDAKKAGNQKKDGCHKRSPKVASL